MTLLDIIDSPRHALPYLTLAGSLCWCWHLGQFDKGLKRFVIGILILYTVFIAFILASIFHAFYTSGSFPSIWYLSLEIFLIPAAIFSIFAFVAAVGSKIRLLRKKMVDCKGNKL